MPINSSSKKPALVVGGVPEHFNLPWHLAIEANAFAEADVEITYRDISGGTGAMMRGLESEELDIAIVLAEGGVSSILKGNPAQIVKTYVESPLIWGIHVAADSNIDSIEQVQDSRYAISRFGSGSHLMAIVDASERGWPTQNLNFEKIGNLAGARKALASGQADTFFWERFTTAPYVQSGEFRCVGERRTLWPAFIICVRNDVLAKRESDVYQVLKIVNDYCDSLMKRNDASQLISDRYKLRRPDVEEWYAQTTWSTDFQKPTKAIDNIIEYLLKLQLIDKKQAEPSKLWFTFQDSSK